MSEADFHSNTEHVTDDYDNEDYDRERIMIEREVKSKMNNCVIP